MFGRVSGRHIRKSCQTWVLVHLRFSRGSAGVVLFEKFSIFCAEYDFRGQSKVIAYVRL